VDGADIASAPAASPTHFVWGPRPAPRRRRLPRRPGRHASRPRARESGRALAPVARLRSHAPLVGVRRAARGLAPRPASPNQPATPAGESCPPQRTRTQRADG
jgi:hypothetical protein